MRVLVAALLLLLATSAAHAQRIEITPFAGYRVGGSFSVLDDDETAPGRDLEVADEPAWGLHLGYKVPDGELELIYARQETRIQTDDLFSGQPVLDLALETWQFGGNYLWGEDQQRVRPYIGVGLGITRLLPEPAGLQDETRFSLSAAAGVKVWLTRNLGLRFEARGFFTVLESDREYFCTLPGTCLVAGDSADLSQAEARGGVVLRF